MSPALRRLCWADGELLPLEIPVVRADDSAYSEGRGCYPTVLIQAGRPRFAARHARRLVHGAAELGLGQLESGAVLRAIAELRRLRRQRRIVRLERVAMATAGADRRAAHRAPPRGMGAVLAPSCTGAGPRRRK
jgi:branched-subunit amino acid aminotransferase/4-amino-4-deoxychorismate lyase